MSSFHPYDSASRPALCRVAAATLVTVLMLTPAAGSTESVAVTPGKLAPRVVCAGNESQSYAVYLPSAYTAERAWPILYCFDPVGMGHRPVEIFQEAAERHGYIVVGSNNSRNGPWKAIVDSARAMLGDVRRRFRLDPKRQYTTGFSGGARAACSAAADYGLAGVIGCGAGFPSAGYPEKIGFVYFGAVGREDFNYSEMQDVMTELTKRGVPQRLAVFEGSHTWLPPALAVEALTWMDLQATRSGTKPKDDAFIAQAYRDALQRAAAITVPGEAYLKNREIAADFAGLTDTSDATRAVASLQDTKPVRQYLAAEKKMRKQEAQWLDRLYAAVEEARHPPEQDAPLGDPFGQFSAGMGNDPMQSSAEGSMSSEPTFGRPNRPNLALLDARPGDRFAAVRRLAAEMQRKSKDNVAARRVLNHGMSFGERARWAFKDGDFASAMVYFEVVTIIRPEAPEPYFAWANACAQKNEKTKARELLQSAIKRGFADRTRIEQLEKILGT